MKLFRHLDNLPDEIRGGAVSIGNFDGVHLGHARIVERLLQQRSGVAAVVPRTPAGYEPVFALYHRNCLPIMEEMLQQGQFRIYDFYQRIPIRFLDPPELPDGWQRALININTLEQLAQLEEENR